MSDFINATEASRILKDAIKKDIFQPESDTAAVFYNYDYLSKKLRQIASAFPINSSHYIAIKANPLVEILKYIKNNGFGLEAASEGEIALAMDAEALPGQTIFDSPAKTEKEIALALKKGIQINADSLDELERINKIVAKTSGNKSIGLRINPQVGQGNIAATSLAAEYSKFGVPLKTNRKKIIAAFREYEWLNGLHYHIGSQGCEMQLLVEGLKTTLELIQEIEQETGRELDFLDIGGGLPVSYHHDQQAPGMQEYGEKVKALLRRYKKENLHLITEFGRFAHANSGFIISKVEYVKDDPSGNTIITHVGADMLVRESLNQGQWYHEYALLDANGEPKTSIKKEIYQIGGPLCFSGDMPARDVQLPQASPGDYLVIHDTGGYTFGMWSRYLSRPVPKIIVYAESSKHISIVRKRESIEEIINFWSK